MSTRSRIAMQEPSTRIRSIYCHHDAYPEYVGKTHLAHYMEPEKISALLDLGDISSLAAEIGTAHSFDQRPEGVVTAYGRDRGETGVEAKYDDDPKQLLQTARACDAEYTYLYRLGRWYLVEKTGAMVLLAPLDPETREEAHVE